MTTISPVILRRAHKRAGGFLFAVLPFEPKGGSDKCAAYALHGFLEGVEPGALNAWSYRGSAFHADASELLKRLAAMGYVMQLVERIPLAAARVERLARWTKMNQAEAAE